VEILLWLVPPAVVTLLAMAWVGWIGREGRGEVDPEVAVRRMAAALSRPTPQRYAAARPRRERSTGIAVRPSRRPTSTKRAS
jgi:hypothetical protein